MRLNFFFGFERPEFDSFTQLTIPVSEIMLDYHRYYGDTRSKTFALTQVDDVLYETRKLQLEYAPSTQPQVRLNFHKCQYVDKMRAQTNLSKMLPRTSCGMSVTLDELNSFCHSLKHALDVSTEMSTDTLYMVLV